MSDLISITGFIKLKTSKTNTDRMTEMVFLRQLFNSQGLDLNESMYSIDKLQDLPDGSATYGILFEVVSESSQLIDEISECLEDFTNSFNTIQRATAVMSWKGNITSILNYNALNSEIQTNALVTGQVKTFPTEEQKIDSIMLNSCISPHSIDVQIEQIKKAIQSTGGKPAADDTIREILIEYPDLVQNIHSYNCKLKCNILISSCADPCKTHCTGSPKCEQCTYGYASIINKIVRYTQSKASKINQLQKLGCPYARLLSAR